MKAWWSEEGESMIRDHVPDDSILATYYIETEGRLDDVARGICELETTGAWFGDRPPTELFLRSKGQVHKVREIDPGQGYVSLLFPVDNLNLETAAFASVWLEMIGGATFALLAYRKSRLVDFSLPDWCHRYFPGPGFGMNGTRSLLGMEDGVPIIGTIVKPTSGLTPEEVAEMCEDAATAGVRFIKDDEKMMSPAYCPLDRRVRLVAQGLKRAEDATGQRVLYAPHITAGPDRIRENAHVALQNGASALMLNFFAAGFGSLELLRRDLGVDVPIYGHCGGREAFGRAEGQGVAPNVVAKLARLMGVDYFRSGIVDSYLVGTMDENLLINETLRAPLSGMLDTVPVLSGGLKPANLGRNLSVFGSDVIALAGSGIFSHPMGSKAGVQAMKQAADAFRAGIAVEEYARDHPELAAAITGTS